MEQDPTDPTGVRETSKSIQQATTIARNRKAAAATYLYVEKHKTLKEVAKKCGYPDAGAARVAIERHMESELREHPRSIAAMREMAGRRLEQLTRSTNKKAQDPDHPEHLAAVREQRANIESWVKIFGLQAPQQVVVTNPTSDAIMEVAMRLVGQATPDVEPGDIFSDEAPDDEVRALQARAAAKDPLEDIVEAEWTEDGLPTGDLEAADA